MAHNQLDIEINKKDEPRFVLFCCPLLFFLLFIHIAEELRDDITWSLLDLGVNFAYVLAYYAEAEQLQAANEPYGAHGA